jgi:hypothetical protein
MIDEYIKLLEAEGHEISYVEDDLIACSSYSFDKNKYGWDGQRSELLEQEWRERFPKISNLLEFGYDEFRDQGKTISVFELYLNLG